MRIVTEWSISFSYLTGISFGVYQKIIAQELSSINSHDSKDNFTNKLFD